MPCSSQGLRTAVAVVITVFVLFGGIRAVHASPTNMGTPQASAGAVRLTITDLDGAAYIVAANGQYLGAVSSNSFDTKSLCNDFGQHGSAFSHLSIKNDFGQYGGEFSHLSPYNPFTASPPRVVYQQRVVALLTKNEYLTGALDPDRLLVALGCPK